MRHIPSHSLPSIDVRLDGGGVQHNADRPAEGLGGQVHVELCAHSAVGAVSAGDASPDGAELGAVLLRLCLVDEANTLAQVEGGGLGVLDTLQLQDVGVVVLVHLRAAVSKRRGRVKSRVKKKRAWASSAASANAAALFTTTAGQ